MPRYISFKIDRIEKLSKIISSDIAAISVLLVENVQESAVEVIMRRPVTSKAELGPKGII